MQPFWGQNVSYQKFGIAFLVINHLCTSIAYRMTSFTCIAPLCIGMCLERSFIHTETPFNSPLLVSPLLYTMAPNNKLTNTFKFQVRNLCPPPLYPSFAGCGNAKVVSMSCKNILRPFFFTSSGLHWCAWPMHRSPGSSLWQCTTCVQAYIKSVWNTQKCASRQIMVDIF